MSKIKKMKKIFNMYGFKSLLVMLFIISIFVYLIYRVFYITVIKGPEYSALAEKQWKKELTVQATRGEIYDRNGSLLATSVDIYRIDLDLVSIRRTAEKKNLSMKELSEQISKAANLDYETVYKKLTTKNEDGSEATYAALTRGVEKPQADAVKELNIYGILISSDTKRFYPNDNFLAHTLGTVNYDGNGLTGLELYYDKYLAGTPGLQILGIDGNMEKLPFVKSKISEPVKGQNLTLTIDESIQFYAEKIAEETLEKNKANKVSIIVSDPNTGEIRAIVSKPDFNPNNPYEDYEGFTGKTDNEKIQSMWRNTIVSDSFEPGSTFKSFVISAALEEGIVNENDTFYCGGGVNFGGIRVRCWKTEGHGVLTLSQVLENSCNSGMMEIGRRIGAEKLNEYIKKFGFGKTTGIDLPGESTGIIKEAENISEIDLGTISFGQTNSVTMLQMITAFNAIANGGYLIEPKIVSEISHTDNNGLTIVDEIKINSKNNRVISEETANKLKKFLENTANATYKTEPFIEGHTAGLKTGTAEKIDTVNGGYMEGKYISSAIALSPIENPELTVYVTVDEAKNGDYYGSVVAAPVAKQLLNELLSFVESSNANDNNITNKNVMIPEIRGLKIEEAKKIIQDKKLDIDISGNGNFIKDIYPLPGTIVKQNSTITAEAQYVNIPNNDINMPSFEGLSKDEAIKILEELNLYYEIKGKGYVISQNITKNTTMKKSSKVILTLEE